MSSFLSSSIFVHFPSLHELHPHSQSSYWYMCFISNGYEAENFNGLASVMTYSSPEEVEVETLQDQGQPSYIGKLYVKWEKNKSTYRDPKNFSVEHQFAKIFAFPEFNNYSMESNLYCLLSPGCTSCLIQLLDFVSGCFLWLR